jgi:hypothetical protein
MKRSRQGNKPLPILKTPQTSGALVLLRASSLDGTPANLLAALLRRVVEARAQQPVGQIALLPSVQATLTCTATTRPSAGRAETRSVAVLVRHCITRRRAILSLTLRASTGT